MATIQPHAYLRVEGVVTLSEPEMRALEALAGYGVDNLLKCFYKEMGRAYLQPHEVGLRSLLATTKPVISEAIRKIDDSRKVWNETHVATLKSAPEEPTP